MIPFIVVSLTAILTFGFVRFREPADIALVILAAPASRISRDASRSAGPRVGRELGAAGGLIRRPGYLLRFGLPLQPVVPASTQ